MGGGGSPNTTVIIMEDGTSARGFYLELSKTLKELGCKQSKLDPALYMWFDKDGKLAGLALTHVDDILNGSGTSDFESHVFEPLRKKFQFGSLNFLVF